MNCGYFVPGAAWARCEHILGTASADQQDKIVTIACRRILSERCLICASKRLEMSMPS